MLVGLIVVNFMMDEIIDTKNIRFEYADNVAPNVNREQSTINNINQWFGGSADLINGQTGTIVVYLPDNKDQRISFDNMTDDLQNILYEKLKKFQPQNARRPDRPGI